MRGRLAWIVGSDEKLTYLVIVLEYWNYLDRPEAFARCGYSVNDAVAGLNDDQYLTDVASDNLTMNWGVSWRFCDSGLPRTW